MKKLLIAAGVATGLLTMASAANAANITIYHYNGTGESVSIANGINCGGGYCSGPYSLRAGQKGVLTNNITATNGAFSLWYGYKTSTFPYHECGAMAQGMKMSWESTYDINYWNRGTNCSMYQLGIDKSNGNFIFQVNQSKY